MALNKVIKLCLETRARELKDKNKSTREIATVLSEESGQKITQSSVQRYFASFESEKRHAVEKRGQLVSKIAEAEISTIEQRQDVIKGLLTLAEKATHESVRVQAYKAANGALDSLDGRLGKLTSRGTTISLQNINMNNVKEIPDAELIRIIEHEQED